MYNGGVEQDRISPPPSRLAVPKTGVSSIVRRVCWQCAEKSDDGLDTGELWRIDSVTSDHVGDKMVNYIVYIRHPFQKLFRIQ